MKKFLFLWIISLLTPFNLMADRPSVHGMFLLGDKVTYAYHLPMFHQPHDYQLVLKVGLSLNEQGSQVLELYEEAKKKGENLFSIAPEIMDLTDVISGLKKSFKAQLFQGHFEQGGLFLGNIVLNVEKILYHKKLNKQDSSSNKFLVFGEKGEAFAAHILGGKPSYDAVYQVHWPVKTYKYQCRRGPCPPHKRPIHDYELPLQIQSYVKSFEEAPKEGELSLEMGLSVLIQEKLYSEDLH